MKLKWFSNPALLKKLFDQYKYVALVILAGIVLLLMPTGDSNEASGQLADEIRQQFDLAAFEMQLANTLSHIEGAGETTVLLTLKNDGLRVLAENQQQDRDGGQSSAVVTVGQGSGVQDVVEVQSYTPQFLGALIVCPGGENPDVQLKLIDAVSAVTGLGVSRISVCKGN